MLAIAAAVFFAIALAIDLLRVGHGTVSPETFALIGLALPALSAVLPGWPRRP